MSKKCSIKKLKWNDDELYSIVGPLAMNRAVIRAVGNPLTTNDKMEWLLGYANGTLVAFAAIEYTKISLSVKNFHAVDGDDDWYFVFVDHAIGFFDVSFRNKLYCYVKTAQLKKAHKLGFKTTTPGKNWHRLIKEK